MSSTTRCLSSVTTRVPELRPFTVRGPQPADFFPPIEADPDGEINMPIGNLPLLIDFHHQQVFRFLIALEKLINNFSGNGHHEVLFSVR